MARKHLLGGKAPQFGNKVSHSNRKTRRMWLPNMQKKALFSVALGRHVRMSLTTGTIRSVDFAGGLDNFLLKESPEKLTRPLRQLQELIRSKQEEIS